MGAKKGTRPPNAGKGRKPGIPNRTTTDVREAIASLLQLNVENFSVWLGQVANGIQQPPAEGADEPTEAKWLLRPDPGKALDLAMSMAEYHIPKLARTELTGPDGGPLQVHINDATRRPA
jgi:hypothetical protein